MANIFINIPVPAANGSGAAVDMSAFGLTKTISVTGPFSAAVTIEISNELAPTKWAPLQTFNNADGFTYEVACRWMRATVANYKSGTPACDVGGTDDGTLFASLPVTAGNGIGAATDVSLLGLFKTITVGGPFGGNVQIEVSEDGITRWSQVGFGFSNAGQQSATIAARWMRVVRAGVPGVAPGLPIVDVAGCTISGGSAGPPGPPGPAVAPKLYTVYVGKNGNDGTADGSIGSPFLTVQAAMEFAWTTYVLPVEPQPVSPFRRPCVMVNAGTYDDGPLVLPPQICVMGEGYNHTRIVGDWTIDARWSNAVNASDFRSSWINLGLFGSVTIDFGGAIASNEGKLYAFGVRFGGLVTITEKIANPVSNQMIFTDVEFLADVTLNGIPTILQNPLTLGGTLTLNQLIGASVDNTFQSSGGSLGNIVVNSLDGVSPPYVCKFGHAMQPGATLTLNGAFSTISAALDAVPLQSLVTLAGGANLNQISRVNQLNWSGITANTPPTPYTGQQYFDATIGKPIWWNGASWISWSDATQPFLLVFRPGGVQAGNVYTVWSDLMAAAALIQGRKIIQFDDRIVTPCVVPAGVWDQTFCEWHGVQNDDTGAAVAVSIGGGPSGGDVILTNFRQISGKIVVTNLNAGASPVTISPTGATRIFFQLGIGLNDGSQIVNNGVAPFFDCTGLAGPQGSPGAQQFLLRMSGQISGTTPAIQFGASSGSLALALFEARIFAGMISGTNPLANINVALVMGSVGFSRQSGWAGTIRRGIPNQAQQATAAGFTPYVRTTMFPAPGPGGVATPPSAVALTPATGLGMNTTMRFNAAAGVIAQTLPQIRAAAPAIGAQPNVVPGVLNSEGMIVIVREFSGLNGVSLTPSAGETIEGGVGAFVVPRGASIILQSDGISDWRVIGDYIPGGAVTSQWTAIVDPAFGSDTTGAFGDLGRAFATIQGALNAIPTPVDAATARTSWTVLVSPGTYDEDLTVDLTSGKHVVITSWGPVNLGLFNGADWTPSGPARSIAITTSSAAVFDFIDASFSLQPMLPVDTGDETTNAQHAAFRISGQITGTGIFAGTPKIDVGLSGCVVFGIASAAIVAGPESIALRVIRSRMRGTVVGAGTILSEAREVRFDNLVDVQGYGRLQQCRFNGMTVVGISPSSNLPRGFYDCELNGVFTGPATDAFWWDLVTDYWFTTNGASFGGGASKRIIETQATVGGSLLFFGATTIAAAADTRFIPPGRIDSGVASTTDVYQLPAPRAGTLKNLLVRHNSAPGNANLVAYTVMKNGVATAITVSLAANAVAQASDLVNTVAVALGDRISLRAVKALGIAASAVDVAASLEVV